MDVVVQLQAECLPRLAQTPNKEELGQAIIYEVSMKRPELKLREHVITQVRAKHLTWNSFWHFPR